MDKATRLDFARALDKHRRGDAAAAEAAYRALYARVAHPKIAHMLALSLHQQQRSEEALAWFERGRADPSVAFHVNHASALLAAGRAAEAEAESRLALSAAPEHVGARLNLALALEAQRRFDAAAAAFDALKAVPEVAPVARRGLVRSLLHSGRIAQAQAAVDAIHGADDPETALLRGELALETGRLDEADAILEIAEASDATRSRAWLLEARLAALRRDSGAAIALLDKVAAAGQDRRAAVLQSAHLLLERGDIPRCLERLRSWVDEHPRDAEAHSAYLRCAQFSSGFDAARLLEAHRLWAERHAATAEFVPARARAAGEPLSVGWLSPAFRNGPVQTFFLLTLMELERRGLTRNTLYNCNPRHDPSSAAWRAACASWRDVADLDDEALVRRIRDDRIDVLVDLAGHAGGGRLAALSRRVAPVQATWLDSFGTTGIAAMDFVLTDRVSTPPDEASHFSEGALYLPRTRLCYEPPVPAERPQPGALRLISLNHFAKLDEAVIAVWANVLRALPDWTLHLQARGGDDAGVAASLRGRFRRAGIDPDRIECSGYAPVAEALRAYRGAAIALDPFPFSGGANSCDALWMGLPLVTWPQDTLISRQGAAFLQALDRPEWIARDAEDYVAIVRELAADASARRRWSEVAAEHVRARLGDATSFAADLVAALERGWQLRAQEAFAAVSKHRGDAAQASPEALASRQGESSCQT